MKCLWFASLLVAVSGAPAPEDSTYEERHASYINGTTSAFVKIIKTNDVRSQDATYFTPAVVFVGKMNGDILRCLQEDPDECEVFYQVNQTPVYSLLISGAYIYAGLGSGNILRCELSKKGSCRTVYTCGENVYSLAIIRGYLYAGLDNSTMRCALNEPYSCEFLHAMENAVNSLIQFEDHIYAGTSSGQLMRCSLRTENICTLLYSVDENNPYSKSITGIAYIGNNVLVLTLYGQLWSCSRKSNLRTDYCVQTCDLDKSDTWAMAAHNDDLYVVNKEGIYICNADDDADCSNYGHHTGARSIAFAYSTFHMQSRYKDEHAACTWQDSHRCPPFVTYYEPQQRSMLEVHVKDGKLRDFSGDLVDTSKADDGHSGPAAIFAMGPDGTILLSNVHKEGLLHSSSLFAGSPVAGTGEMVVENGVIKKMTTCSEHYGPDLVLNRQVIESLRYQGYTVPIDSQICCRDDECGNVSSNAPLENIQSMDSQGNISSDNKKNDPLQYIQPIESEGIILSDNTKHEARESVQPIKSEENIPSEITKNEAPDNVQPLESEGNIPAENIENEAPESVQPMESERNIPSEIMENEAPESVQPMESEGNILPDNIEYEAVENIEPVEPEY